jgi:adenine-specific DNA-methyltransferase
LFLKLLEAQLITYHKGDKSYSFLNLEKIKNYDDLNSLFFQVLARKYDERNDDVKKAFEKVPYLNSSLFEPTEIEQLTLFISNLRDDKTIPVISSTVLKDRQGKKLTGNLTTLEYLFEFLNAYDFSSEGSEEIQEDNKTLINASVLGLIFEKINGYKDGSFFTPGFITMYMCRETIRKAVLQKFNDTKKWNCHSIEELYDKIGDRTEANQIVNSIKVCDPAVGSGHFLVSALNEMIAVKNDLKILQDRNGKRLKEYQVEVVNDELIVTDEEGELFEYNPSNKESQRIQETLFHEKQTIIENCLFGVDINANSVKICRLRLWIELLKNAYYVQTLQATSPLTLKTLPATSPPALETLPNIDINIKCGNSLVSRFAIDADLKQALKKSKWTIDGYRIAVATYRKAQSKEQKRAMERLIADIKSDFRSEISRNDPKVKKLYALNGELLKLTTQQSLFAMSTKEKADWHKMVTQLTEATQKLEAEIEEIKANKIFENAFEWRFEFPEVLNDEGDFVGFDVVIGNPPYGIEFSDREKEFLKVQYEFLVERIRNSFLYFIGLGLSITGKSGTLNYIVPNEILFQIYMTKARNYFLKEKKIIAAVNLGDNVFEDAVVSSAILEIQNRTEEKYSVLMADIREKIKHKYINPNDLIKVSSDSLKANFNQIYVVGSEKSNLVNRLMSNFINLEKISINIANGISTSCDKVYIANGETINAHKIEKSVSKRTIRGSNFNKFWIDNNVDDYVLYVTKDTLIDKVPNTIAYLEPNKELLIKSSVEKNHGKRDWHILFRPREESDFVAPKILVRQTADRIIAALDNEIGFYPIDTVNVVKLESEDLEFNLAVLGILNSKLITFFYQEISQEGGRILAQVKPSRVKAVPIPNLTNTKLLSKLVSQIIAKKQEIRDTTDLENQIDQLVYQLYDLTKEEIEIIENASK